MSVLSLQEKSLTCDLWWGSGNRNFALKTRFEMFKENISGTQNVMAVNIVFFTRSNISNVWFVWSKSAMMRLCSCFLCAANDIIVIHCTSYITNCQSNKDCISKQSDPTLTTVLLGLVNLLLYLVKLRERLCKSQGKKLKIAIARMWQDTSYGSCIKDWCATFPSPAQS